LIIGWIKKWFATDKKKYGKLHNLLGYYPGNMAVYNLALKHISLHPDPAKNNERLEFLGDAVLDSIIADFLFKKYPIKGEGFLTEVKSKIVSRKKLGEISRRMGLDEMITLDENQVIINETILGNTLEAIIGAIYLDKDYEACRYFVLDKIIAPYINMDQLMLDEINYKSKLLEWAQSLGKKSLFHCVREVGTGRKKQFWVDLLIDDKKISTGIGTNKKNAEKEAARLAIEKLNIQ